LTRQLADFGAELAIERLVGQALRDQPCQQHAQRPQQQQRGEHPVEDLAEQRTVLARRGRHNSPS